ncbi:MAG: type II toxin-antitoxin system HicB family antitoxin [Clostridia bacterium]|nr:type II toxin-antitoxin system HicB family antitoxin [Clostridia bacterium]
MKVIYPVLFYEEGNGSYSVFVPDLEKALNTSAATCGYDLEEAMTMAEELIAGIVLDAMEDNNKIPHASKIDEISFEELEKNLDIENWNYKSKFKTYIVVDISKFAEKWGKELVKKTVNIPKWVNSKAESLKINFSKTLEEALLQKIYNNK